MDGQQEGPFRDKQLSLEESESWNQKQKEDTLLIKLKMLVSKEESYEETRLPILRTCEYCGKEFTNGKALGGHIRIHTQESRFKNGGGSLRKLKRKTDELSQEKNLGSAEKSHSTPNDEEEQHSCCICDRKFPSNKSLCGHMRFHPERSWRGVQPPPTSPEIEKEDDVQTCSGMNNLSECMVDLLRDLPSWSKTEKRGRKNLSELEPEAAHGLMKLAHAISDNSGSSDDEAGDHTPGSKKLPLGKKEDEIFQSSEKGSSKKTKSQESEKVTDNRIKLEMDSDKGKIEDPSNVGSSVPLKICKKKITSRFRFQCNTCDKIFPTFQALGGHRSSHNKEKGTIVNLSEISASTGISASEKQIITENTTKEEQDSCCHQQGRNDDLPSTQRTTIHQCEICCKKFPTGQALGGHKRSHWTGGQLDQAPSVEAVSPSDQASVNGPRLLPIDLNELPTMDDEEILTSSCKA